MNKMEYSASETASELSKLYLYCDVLESSGDWIKIDLGRKLRRYAVDLSSAILMSIGDHGHIIAKIPIVDEELEIFLAKERLDKIHGAINSGKSSILKEEESENDIEIDVDKIEEFGIF